jgi:hypothetical protein
VDPVAKQYVEHLQTMGIDATQIALDRKGPPPPAASTR